MNPRLPENLLGVKPARVFRPLRRLGRPALAEPVEGAASVPERRGGRPGSALSTGQQVLGVFQLPLELADGLPPGPFGRLRGIRSLNSLLYRLLRGGDRLAPFALGLLALGPRPFGVPFRPLAFGLFPFRPVRARPFGPLISGPPICGPLRPGPLFAGRAT